MALNHFSRRCPRSWASSFLVQRGDTSLWRGCAVCAWKCFSIGVASAVVWVEEPATPIGRISALPLAATADGRADLADRLISNDVLPLGASIEMMSKPRCRVVDRLRRPCRQLHVAMNFAECSLRGSGLPESRILKAAFGRNLMSDFAGATGPTAKAAYSVMSSMALRIHLAKQLWGNPITCKMALRDADR